MRALVVGFLLFIIPLSAVGQERPVRELFYAVTQNTDYPGNDLGPIYDATFDGCLRACQANEDCAGFTFNRNNGACFPKSAFGERESYDGALSARLFPTDPAVLAGLDDRLTALDFISPAEFTRARNQSERFNRENFVGTWTLERILDTADTRIEEGEISRAMSLLGAAISLSDDPQHWMRYARLALDFETSNNSQRRNMDRAGLSAALNAAMRADAGSELARAMLILSEALEARNQERLTVPALRVAEANDPSAEVIEALDRAIRLFGFRVIGNRVDHNAADPRICVLFSEDIAGGATPADYLQSSLSGLSVEAEGREYCVSGVTHGQRYEFSIRAGLPAQSGETLRHPAPLRLYVQDRTPTIRFPGRAYVLPRNAGGHLPIVTVNTDEVALALHMITDRNVLRSLQEQYFGQPLSEWQLDRMTLELAETVWDGTGEVSAALNQDVTTSLPMGAVLSDLTPGLYALEARIPGPANRDAPPATQWFFVSDIGISTVSGSDGVHVTLRSLADTSALTGIPVQLVSESNRVLATLETDEAGNAHFNAEITAGQGSARPALIMVEQDQDFAFLSLREAEFDLSDRGVEGRPSAPPIDVFLTTERGVYRAGETIHATALARDSLGTALSGLPLTAILTRADGVEYSRMILDETGAGGFVWQMPLGTNVPRGTWRLGIYSDPDAPALASQAFLVEDFLPERIDLALDLPEGMLPTNEPIVLNLQADYLFGAPGANLGVAGDLALRPVTRLAAHPGYSFGRHDDRPDAYFTGLSAPQGTDDEGQASVPITLPEFNGAPFPREMTITARVIEGSGRPVERQITRMLEPNGPLIGIRPLFDGAVPDGSEAEFHVIASGTEALPVSWVVNRVERRYQWFSQNGRWSWDRVTTRTRIAEGEAVLGTEPLALDVPLDWGRYEIRIESSEGPYTASSMGFRAGWYADPDAGGTPDLLEVSLDAETYAVGDEARLRIVPRTGGTALIRVVSNRVIHQEVVEIGDDPSEIPLTVTDEWGSGAYVTATLIRPLDGLPPQTPARALGLAHAFVDPGEHALDVVLQTPITSNPRGPLEVVLRVANTSPGDTVYASIAAVDLGILNLTGFDSPDPEGHYFGQRRMGVGLRDLYGRLITAGGQPGAIRSGGDASAGMRMQTPPPTEELVAFHSGPLTVGADGTVRATFDMPAFNGTVRVMAVAWSETGIGQAEADVLVRDPVVLTTSIPRFMAPGDSGRLLIQATHVEGPTGMMPIEIEMSSGLSLPSLFQAVLIEEDGDSGGIDTQITAMKEGLQSIDITLETPDGRRLTQNLQIMVEANDPIQATTSRVTLAPGESLTLDDNLLAGLRPGSASAMISAGPLARFDAPGLLSMLDRYPYGCTEQVTSAAMPLLYMADVAEAMGLGHANDLGLRIQDAVDRVLVNQAPNGGFGLWGAHSTDPWLNAYVTDFLSRARAEGYRVPDLAFQSAIDNLRNHVANASDFENGGQSIAYSLMVLAREGTAAIGDLRYYADVKAENFATPLALGQLGAALAMYGDQPRADAMFRAGYALLLRQGLQSERFSFRRDFGTRRRDATGLLTLAAQSGSDAIPLAELAAALPTPTAHVSTQEAVWSLLAASALIDQQGTSSLAVSDGASTEPMPIVLRHQAGITRTLTNTGDHDEVLTVTRYGQAEGATQAGGQGYAISRRYVTMDGVPADPSQVHVGTRLIAILTVTAFEDRDARLMVNDPLPAGFEIDNPNLLRAGDISALGDLDLNDDAEHVEFRQDRFLAAIDHFNGQDFRLGYVIRAVSHGRFHHPAASVEDMYRPQFRAQTDSGVVYVHRITP